MKRIKPQGIKELIGKYVRERGITGALSSARVYSAWNEAVGQELASYTKHRYFSRGVLYCSIESSAARNYLASQSESLVSKMNEILGRDAVKQLVIR